MAQMAKNCVKIVWKLCDNAWRSVWKLRECLNFESPRQDGSNYISNSPNGLQTLKCWVFYLNLLNLLDSDFTKFCLFFQWRTKRSMLKMGSAQGGPRQILDISFKIAYILIWYMSHMDYCGQKRYRYFSERYL